MKWKQFVLDILYITLAPTLFGVAIYFMYIDISGWGWLLVCAMLCFPSLKQTKKCPSCGYEFEIGGKSKKYPSCGYGFEIGKSCPSKTITD